MAFGRSNSLSLNTGATNSLFNQQQQATTAQSSGGLFGTANSQPQQSGGLFGSSTTQNQPSGGLFGSSTAPNQQPGGLFGNTASQQSGGAAASTPSLFGANAQQNQAQNQQQGQTSGGMFGNLGGQNQNATQQQGAGSGGLFGSLGGGQNQNATQQQGQTGGGLFGNLGGQNTQQQNTGGGLFGNAGQNTAQSQQQGGNSLFGGLGNQNKPAGASLFGGSTSQQQPQQNSNNQQSLFGTSVFNNPSSGMQNPMKLTMGQGQQQQQTAPGVKIDISNIRPTTRFGDLHDDIKKHIEQIDTFIKQQESYASQCEALLPNHSSNVDSVTPDVDLIAGKVETVELSLENDSRDIKAAKDLLNEDAKDLTRCVRVIENLALPSQYHYGPSLGNGASRARIADEDYDVDLVGYFTRQANAMQKTLDTFTSNISEIESHLRVIEANTVQQSQQVAAQRAGGASGNDAVRELSDTLRGFENGILDAAGFVGACREGVNELILGRVGDGRRRY